MQTILTSDEERIIASEAIELAKERIAACTHADSRLRARKLLDAAESALTYGATRPSLAWSCRAVRATDGFRSESFAAVQAKYDVVYNSHLDHSK